MHERAAPSRGAIVGLALLAAALVVEAGLVWAVARTWPGPVAAVLFVAALGWIGMPLTVAYWLWGLLSLRYVISRDGIVLRWAASRTTVPMSDITHLLKGREYGGPLRGLRWPGHEVGRTTLSDPDGAVREMLVLATVPPEGQLIVVTPDLAYALSPADRATFVAEFKMRLRMGPVQQLEHGTRHPLFARLGIARDGLALRLAAVAAAVNVLAFAWLIWQMPTLPPQVALRHGFDPVLGLPVTAALAPRALAWQLPAIGLAVLAVNAGLAAAVHARARLGALSLLLGAVVLQLTLIVTLAHMVP